MKVVPSGAPTSSKTVSFAPSMHRRVPVMSFFVLVTISTFDTAAMLESASPRNPILCRLIRSTTELILLVAWRMKALRSWSCSMPEPSSVTRINSMPPSLISTVTAPAPASMAFSTSSLTTLAGRSTTSPAAILSIVASSSTCISAISVRSFLLFYHRFFSLFCSLYSVFSASSGVRLEISISLSSLTMSSSLTVSNSDICPKSTSS